MPTKTVKLGVLTTGIDHAISDMAKLGAAKDKVGGDTTVRMRLVGADITESELATLAAEIKGITEKGATVRVSMAGGTGDLAKVTAQSEALAASGAKVSTVLEEEGAKAESAGAKVRGGLGSALSSLGLTPLTAGLAGVGVAMAEGVKQSTAYQKELALLVTDAGESDKNLGMVGKGIEGIAEETGTSLSQLTSGMFMIESAGYHGAAGLTVLRAASEGAKTSGADLGTTADALTTVMTDFKMKTGQATSAMSGLNAIVANGKTHLQDIAASMSRVLPTASSLHVSFGEVGGAMATMTGEGISAKMAAMGINTAMLALAAPNAVATKSMNELGMSTKDYAKYQELVTSGNKKAAAAMLDTQGTARELANTLTHQGLVAALAKVADLALQAGPKGSAAYIAAMKSMVGGNKGLQVALALTGQNLETTQRNVAKVSGAVKSANKDVTGWSVTQATLSNRMGQFKEILQVSAVQLGTLVIPALTATLGFISKMLTNFISLPGPTKIAVSAILGFGVVILMFGKIKAAATTAFTALTDTNPVILAITALLVIALLVVTHWKLVSAYFDKFRHDTANIFDGLRSDIVRIWNVIYAFMRQWGQNFLVLFGPVGIFAAIVLNIIKYHNQIAAFMVHIWDLIWNNTIARIERGLHDVSTEWDILRHNISAKFANILQDIGHYWDVIWANTITKIANGITNAVNWFKRIPGEVLNAIGNVTGYLKQKGMDLINGLYSGITAILADAGNWVKVHIFNPIVNAIKSLFGISSPSRVMANIGGHLVSGLMVGLLKSNPVNMIKKIFGSLPSALGSLVEKGLVSITQLPAKALNALAGLGSKLMAVLGIGGKGTSANVAGWLEAALAITGKPLSWLDPLEILVGKESGGNPSAYNPISVDGEHATGLMQMLSSTFAAYELPGFGNILNPLDNAIASIRYISAEYGSPMNIPGLSGGNYVGYDQGGVLMPGFHMVANLSGKPEQVIPAGGIAGGNTINIYCHPSNNPDEIYEQVWQGLRNLRRHKGNQPLGLG